MAYPMIIGLRVCGRCGRTYIKGYQRPLCKKGKCKKAKKRPTVSQANKHILDGYL